MGIPRKKGSKGLADHLNGGWGKKDESYTSKGEGRYWKRDNWKTLKKDSSINCRSIRWQQREKRREGKRGSSLISELQN